MNMESLEKQIRQLVGDSAYQRLIDNGRIMAERKGTDEEPDFIPVVKLFLPGTSVTWLLTELDPDEPGLAFGLADLGMGFPELGSIWLPELLDIRKDISLCEVGSDEPFLEVEVTVNKDRHFEAQGSLRHYARMAREAGSLATVC